MKSPLRFWTRQALEVVPSWWCVGRRRAFEAARAGHPPIFIVGCGHSGTTLLLAVLDSHSRIQAIPFESNLAHDGGARLSPYAHAWLRRFDALAIRHGKWRWVEKTPRHIHAIPLLRQLCPGAKILLLLRDGRDVACSIRDRTGNLEQGILRWVDDNRAGEASWRDPAVRVVRYEDLIADFRGTLRGIMTFLGEDYEEVMERYHQTPRRYYARKIEQPPNAAGANHESYRNWQINQPLFDGRGRWQRLTSPEKEMIKRHAGPMLIQYNYAIDESW